MTEVVAELSGTLYDKLSRTSRPVYLRVKGNAMAIDAGGPGDPPGIWGGPIDPYPGHPLPEPPGRPGDPPHIWGGPIDPYPGHPLPEPPGKPDVPPPEGSKPPPPDGGWGYPAEFNQWGYFPGPTEARPKG